MLSHCFALLVHPLSMGSFVKTFAVKFWRVFVTLQREGKVIKTTAEMDEIKVHMQKCAFEYMCVGLDDSKADFV